MYLPVPGIEPTSSEFLSLVSVEGIVIMHSSRYSYKAIQTQNWTRGKSANSQKLLNILLLIFLLNTLFLTSQCYTLHLRP